VIQLVERLRELHGLGYTHNDLKLENLLIGKEDPSKLYLIDFGLSSAYLHKDRTHVEKEYLGKFRGNFLYGPRSAFKA